MKIKKTLIALIFSFSILIGNFLPVFALDLNGKNSISIEKTDSTLVPKNITEKLPEVKKNKVVQKAKPTSRVTYSIILYIIAKFMQLNPFTRPS